MSGDADCVYYVAATLDGFIAGPNDELDWLTDNFSPEEADYAAFFARVSGIVMGRKTYEIARSLSAEWPYETRPTLVATRRRLSDAPEGAFAFSGKPGAMHEALRGRGAHGLIWLEGGGDLAGQFLAAGLVDRLDLAIIPVLLGSGIRLFGGVPCPRLRLERATPLPSGMVFAQYRLPR